MDKPKLSQEDLEKLCYIDESSYNGKLSEEDKKKLAEKREENRKKLAEKWEENRKKFVEDGVCLNCNSFNGRDWKYCQQCGTKRGEGEFDPFKNRGLDILLYGPIDLYYFKCKKCGHKWCTDIIYVGKDTTYVYYCPNCGTKKIKMYYSESDPYEQLQYYKKDVTLIDIVKYKYRKICNIFYRIKRKIIERFNDNKYEK